MNYEKIWNQLKNNVKAKSNTPFPHVNDPIKATEQLATRSTYFEILDIMQGLETVEKSNDMNKKFDL